MDNSAFRELIYAELSNLTRLSEESKGILSGISDSPDVATTRAAGSILHDFYNGVENIFKRIAQTIDCEVPSENHWHKELLALMTKPTDRRKNAISSELSLKLKDYLKFRHLYRNTYGFDLSWNELTSLIQDLGNITAQFKQEIEEFLGNLQH
ncbi:MAG: hypothetical protein PHW04_06800 [Candidatus Wallbacteria bacterium]|nr:hypothetical protein [Candidatus Wallbacteria bacterium]